MNEPLKKGQKDWRLVCDSSVISRAISRMSYEVLEKDRDLSRLAIVGVKRGGEHLARRIHQKIFEIEKVKLPLGVLDITLYRDDLAVTESYPTLKGTDLPFRISGSRIVLVDDVLYTGRTVRAALDAIIDFGRPKCVELAVLVDRGHRELPIRPDYVGKNIPTSINEVVRLQLEESGYEDGVYVFNKRS